MLTHTQNNPADFYRELGDIFSVDLNPHNRWGGFKNLRERWHGHIDNTLLRPLLLIDEAQDMSPAALCEMRLLSSTRFDSSLLLSVVLAGYGCLPEKLRREELLPLGSRIRTQLVMEYAARADLLAALQHLLTTAGNPN